MATLVMQAVGSVVSSQAVGPLFGTGAGRIGGALGGIAGGVIDDMLFPQTRKVGRLNDLSLQSSTEGAAIPRIDGIVRIAGQLIWASKFKETTKTSTVGGGKGGGSKTSEYRYAISFAVGLCQGEVKSLGRIWADGNLLTASDYTIRFHSGSESQWPDPLIAEIEGAGNTPAYRGLAYVVFEDMPLADFGNRIPQLQFELTRPLSAYRRTDALENAVRAVNLIPGAGEWVYASDVVVRDFGGGRTAAENQANMSGVADAVASLNDLADAAPNLAMVSLTVGWFASDLRAGICAIAPKVDEKPKECYDLHWRVADLARADVATVTSVDGYPAYGGTPSDNAVKQMIAAVKARGWKLTFYPFLFMDIAAGNTLPDPYSDHGAAIGQGAYPWRGRITCSPAPGFAGSADKSAAAAEQVQAFFDGTQGYRRMVLHYASLCRDAGGVDAFLIGSELKGLTALRDGAGAYPAVAALKRLAGDVKAILGSGCAVGYAADWSEWNGHQTGDAQGAFCFHLDPLWSDAAIDFIGIDNYMPIADWRDGVDHRDYDAAGGIAAPYAPAYLQANIAGGEYYDWYYASDADRDAQIRTPIRDDAYGKPWLWRAKDLWNWWRSRHYDRVDGQEAATATAWVPQSKPIRFTELGCPAVDKGANQPNLFYDLKSSESAFPWYSAGGRDDTMMRAFLEAHLSFWSVAANNPLSAVTGKQMVDVDSIALWAWDARPYPFFPARRDLWADADNYALGHWLNGRLGAVLLADLVAEICEGAGFAAYDVSRLSGLVTGYVRGRTLSAREELEELAKAYFFDAIESEGVIRFVMRGRGAAQAIGEDNLVLDTDGEAASGFSLTRTQDADLPIAYRMGFTDAGNAYERGSIQARRLAGDSARVLECDIPLVMDRAQAGGIGDRMLQEMWQARERAVFALPPSFLALDPGDEVAFDIGGRVHRLRLEAIADTDRRDVEAISCDPSLYDYAAGSSRATVSAAGLNTHLGRALLVFLDLPMLTGSDAPHAPHLAAYADPWPGNVLLYRSAGDDDFVLDRAIGQPASIGETIADFYSGPLNRWDEVNALYVRLYAGALGSRPAAAVLNGAGALALRNGESWEIVQFREAELIGSQSWRLGGLLRGQCDSAEAMADPLPAGAQVVVLNGAIVPSELPAAQFAGEFHYRWGPEGRPISDSAYQSATHRMTGLGLCPFAPCHVGAARQAYGDVLLRWIRRDRDPAADDWTGSEVPLSEASEAYDVAILDAGGSVRRRISGLTVSSYLYTAAEQSADFGTPLRQGDALTVSVCQMSAAFGRGRAATRTLTV